MKTSFLLKRLLPLFLLVSSVIISCQKEPTEIEDQSSSELPKITSRTNYSVRNELLPFYYQDQSGVEYFARPPKVETFYPGCGDDYLDNLAVTYTGGSSYYDCGGTGDATITMTWTFVLPANTVPSVGTNTRIRYRFATTDPYSYSTSVYINLNSGPYTNPSTGQSVKKWTFTGTFPVPDGECCMKNAYYGSMYKVETDCSDVPEFTNAAVVDYLTPATYSVNPLYASDASTALNFNVYILTTLCFNCHYPSLGDSPEYIIRWRIAGSGAAWNYQGITQTYTPPVVTVTVPANGTYEYEYSGKLTSGTPGTWTPYRPNSVSGTVTVF